MDKNRFATGEVYPMDQKPSDILTIKGLSPYPKISKSTLHKFVREGKIPTQKVGCHWRFRKETTDRWLDETRAEVLKLEEEE